MLDSLAVSFVFLVGTRPVGFIVGNAANNYLGKLAMAILLTPVIYLGHNIFRRYVPEEDAPAILAGSSDRPDIDAASV